MDMDRAIVCIECAKGRGACMVADHGFSCNFYATYGRDGHSAQRRRNWQNRLSIQKCKLLTHLGAHID